MPSRLPRRLTPEEFAALRGEIARAAVELSDDQLIDLADSLHELIRRRRRRRSSGRTDSILDEPPWIG